MQSSTEEIAKVRFQHQERKRQQMIQLVSETREKLKICKEWKQVIKTYQFLTQKYLKNKNKSNRRSVDDLRSKSKPVSSTRVLQNGTPDNSPSNLCHKCREQKQSEGNPHDSGSTPGTQPSTAMERLHKFRKTLSRSSSNMTKQVGGLLHCVGQ